MSNPVADALARLSYTAAQGARVAWYSAHYALARRLSGPVTPPQEPQFKPQTQAGDPRRIRQAFLDLFAQDRANIEAGLYPAPADFNPARLLSALDNSRRFFADLRAVDERRLHRRGQEVAAGAADAYPSYYLQNFHYQTGGWLTAESARLYDTQVEVLFAGAADAMRRVGLGLLAKTWRGVDQRGLALIDVGCGNGRFLVQALEAFPRLDVTGLDLSPAYLAEARRRLADRARVDFVQAAAEAIPAADARFDAASCIYLFHELPPRARKQAAAEMARVVKPGGALLFVDSLQAGDAPDLDRMLEYFPVGFHEPYYRSYQQEDLPALFAQAGFAVERTQLAFLSKAMLFRRL